MKKGQLKKQQPKNWQRKTGRLENSAMKNNTVGKRHVSTAYLYHHCIIFLLPFLLDINVLLPFFLLYHFLKPNFPLSIFPLPYFLTLILTCPFPYPLDFLFQIFWLPNFMMPPLPFTSRTATFVHNYTPDNVLHITGITSISICCTFFTTRTFST